MYFKIFLEYLISEKILDFYNGETVDITNKKILSCLEYLKSSTNYFNNALQYIDKRISPEDMVIEYEKSGIGIIPYTFFNENNRHISKSLDLILSLANIFRKTPILGTNEFSRQEFPEYFI